MPPTLIQVKAQSLIPLKFDTKLEYAPCLWHGACVSKFLG